MEQAIKNQTCPTVLEDATQVEEGTEDGQQEDSPAEVTGDNATADDDEDEVFATPLKLPVTPQPSQEQLKNQEEEDRNRMPAPPTSRDSRPRTRKTSGRTSLSSDRTERTSRSTSKSTSKSRKTRGSSRSNSVETKADKERTGSYAEENPTPTQTADAPNKIRDCSTLSRSLGSTAASSAFPFSPTASTVSLSTPQETNFTTTLGTELPTPLSSSPQDDESEELSLNTYDTIVREIDCSELFAHFRHKVQCDEAKKQRDAKGFLQAKTVYDLHARRSMLVQVKHPVPELSKLLTALVFEDRIHRTVWLENAQRWSENLAMSGNELRFFEQKMLMEKNAKEIKAQYPPGREGKLKLDQYFRALRAKSEAQEGMSFWSQPSQPSQQQDQDNTYNDPI